MKKLKLANKKQKGAALILMAFIIGIATAAYLLHALNPERLRIEQDKKTYQSLNEAKQALIAWAVNHPNTPGLMPYPDRNGDGNYDDTSDCYISTVNFNTLFTLGRLPLFRSDPFCINAKANVTYGLAEDFRDGANERLWYEVSSNLLHDYKNNGGNPNGTSPIINPSIVNNPNPIYPWFVLRDRNGVVISDRVAAVIIAPGAPRGAQDRSGGIANANQYLDKVVMADGTPYQNYGYQDPTTNPVQEFIIGDDYRVVAKNDPTYKNQSIEPYYYNDKLVYITIDELMAALSQRAAAEAKTRLINYKSATDLLTPLIPNDGYYPFASAFVSTEHYQINNQFAGFLPSEQPTQTTFKTCSVTYTNANSSSSVCDSSSFASVDFTRASGTFTGIAGTECSRTNANKTCSCNVTSGTSRCNGTGGRRFTCSTAGCTTTGNLPGEYVFKGVFEFAAGVSPVKVNKESGICKGCGGNSVSCTSTGAASGDFSYDVTIIPVAFNSATTNSALPVWFTANSWQNYLFYSVSNNCVIGQLCNIPDIQVGGKLAVEAMLASVGSPIISAPFAVKGSAQTGSGCDVEDYLDSTENTNSDISFEASNKQRATNYNDQTFVVTP